MSPATPPASIKAPSISLPRVTAICMTAEDVPRSWRIGPIERFVTVVLTSLVRLTRTQAVKSHQRCLSCVVAEYDTGERGADSDYRPRSAQIGDTTIERTHTLAAFKDDLMTKQVLRFPESLLNIFPARTDGWRSRRCRRRRLFWIGWAAPHFPVALPCRG